MESTNIIGFVGNKECGKSEAAKQLVRHIARTPYSVRRFSFASKLKQIARDVYDLSENQVYGDLKETEDKRWEVTPRYVMQKIGQSFREIHSDTWVLYTERRIQNSDTDFAVIDDVRYLNESNMIQRNDGLVVGITRPGNEINDDHESETQLQRCWDEMTNEVIKNDGTIEELKNEVLTVSHKYLFE